jgi:DNA-entry nuclease
LQNYYNHHKKGEIELKKLITGISTIAILLSMGTTSASARGFGHVSVHTTPHVSEHFSPHVTEHETNHFTKEPRTHSYHSYNRSNYHSYNNHHTGIMWFLFGWMSGHHTNQSHTANTTKKAAATPSKSLATSVMTTSIKNQIGKEVKYNNAGAFIVNNNKSTLNANVNVAPYATNTLDSQKRAADGEALLNKTTRQYQNRQSTNNGASDWKPAGFIQRSNLSGTYSHAYNRGHLLGYALVGNLKGFDASESNAKNIATQTAWANEARDTNSTGQNYYEGLVRKALDQNKTVRYSVKDLYENKTAKVPSGAWIQAKSKDGSINFNVFVPNVQAGLKINYQTGNTTLN